MHDLDTYLQERRRLVDEALDHYLPGEDERPEVLHRAMRYSIFAGGKRLRPILCLAVAETLGTALDSVMLPAIALEALHTYTLIHDDLPAMDDDDLRRGQPTCHIAFGEANAILAGDALLTLTFDWLSRCAAPAPYAACQYARELTEASGSRGLVAGQVEDLAAEGEVPTEERVRFIHVHKTAALFRAAFRIGAVAGGASADALQALTECAEHVGLGFQIADDLLNETSTPEAMGKAAGSDRIRGKMTYVALYGIEGAQAAAQQERDAALAALERLPCDTTLMADIVRRCIDRRS